jgi:hypothetical protein
MENAKMPSYFAKNDKENDTIIHRLSLASLQKRDSPTCSSDDGSE